MNIHNGDEPPEKKKKTYVKVCDREGKSGLFRELLQNVLCYVSYLYIHFTHKQMPSNIVNDIHTHVYSVLLLVITVEKYSHASINWSAKSAIFVCLATPLLNRSHFSRVWLKGRKMSFHIVRGFRIRLLNINVRGIQTFSHTCIAYIIMHIPKLTQIFNISLENSCAIFPQNV